jgi:UDP-glucose 4-epimerase
VRALVIGGNGFIGSNLVQRLREAGDEVRVLDVGAPRSDFDWSGISYTRAEITDAAALASALNSVDVVYHSASTTVPSTSNLDPISDVEQNLVGMLRLLEAMRALSVSRIVFLSSGGTVYGNPRIVPVPEEHPLDPICSYGVVKVAIEKYLQMYEALYGLQAVVLRPSNPYGPRQGTSGIQGLVGAFLGKMLRGEQLTIWGDGEVVRDYIFIDDLVELAMRAGHGATTGVFNVGSGVGCSINDVVAAIRRVTHLDPDVKYLDARAFDVRRVVLDIRKAREAFAWNPAVAIDAGIAHTWAWLRQSHAMTSS